MEYVVDNRRFILSYSELRELYYQFKEMSDEEFINNLPKVLHFVSLICWFKELCCVCLNDRGLLHRLIHLLDESERMVELEEIRILFNNLMKLD